jgi:tRNA-splicing ligase RtcB
VELVRVSEHEWERTPAANGHARVRLLGSEAAQDPTALVQLERLTAFAGSRGEVLALPNLDAGRELPEGCVLAADGLVVPAAAGVDLGCGVRVLAVRGVRQKKAREHRGELAKALADAIPARTGTFPLRAHELDQVLRDGAAWAVARKFGEEEDLARLEGGGRIAGAEPRHVSADARVRAAPQLGTLGAGAHFVELTVVEELTDERAAAALGLEPGALLVVVHTGSRALGQQVSEDFTALFRKHSDRDAARAFPELAAAPLDSDAGQAFLGAALAAENFALANRQVITQRVRTVLREAFGALAIDVAFDSSHNHVRRELHGGVAEPRELLVHRKGALRALGPGHADLPDEHRALGQPLLLPGGLGRPSFVLLASGETERRTLSSLPHGVGRARTQAEACARTAGRDLRRELTRSGLVLRTLERSTTAEHVCEAWRELDPALEVLVVAGLARPLARLTPFVLVRTRISPA